jgi:hypothetical protein
VSRYASSAASALLGAGLAAIAFAGGSGFALEDVTWVETGAVAAGALMVALAILRGRGGRLDGGFTLIAFGALAVLCAVSIAWSIAPDRSWQSANLTVAYVALFAGGMALARLWRTSQATAIVLRGVLLAAAVVVMYALYTRMSPSLLRDEVFARLGAPYGYWNALGTTAALAVVPTLWLGARRTGHQAASALAYPLMSFLLIALFLSYSRGALIMAGIGAALWVAFVPLRLRSVTLIGVSVAGAAPVIVWALGQEAFTKNAVAPGVREAVATEFGLWVLATVFLMLGAGLAIGFRVARRAPRARARFRMGASATVVACVVPIVLAIVLANSDRGLGGTIQQGYESLTSISKATPVGPSRLLSASSARGLYWHQAKEVFLDHYWKGSGADTYAVARLRYRPPTDRTVPQHAHGYLHQTAADLGTAGLLLSLVLAIAWLLSVRRATGVLRRARSRVREFSPERIGLIALALCALVFGMHSLVDWVWYVPGPAAMALVAAGFVAGRGPLGAWRRETGPAAEAALPGGAGSPPAAAAPAGSAAGLDPAPVQGAEAAPGPVPGPSAPAPVAAATSGGVATLAPPAAAAPADGNGRHPAEADTAVLTPLSDLPPPPAAPPPDEPPPPALPGPRRSPRPALALLALVVAALCCWSAWQPLRSDRESDRALDLAANNHVAEARRAVQHAHEIDPLSPRPYVVRNAIEDAAGNPVAAQKALEQAVLAFPGDPQTWIQLAQYQLNARNMPAEALKTVVGALYLDPQSRAAQTVYFQADAALNGGTAPVPPPAPPVGTPPPAPTPTPTPPPTTPVPTAPAPPVSGGTPAPGG